VKGNVALTATGRIDSRVRDGSPIHSLVTKSMTFHHRPVRWCGALAMARSIRLTGETAGRTSVPEFARPYGRVVTKS